MQITNLPISDIKEADYNPRQMTEKQVADLTASIEEFGFVDPFIVNRHPDRMNVLVGGHQRLKIARSRGLTEVPCVFVELELEGEKRLNVRLNKNNGEWNWELLANHFDEHDLIDLGFDKNDLNFFDVQEDGFDEKEELANITEPKVKTGEVYTLGYHRLMCGDSTSADDFERLMQGDKARLIFTDPPYSVNYGSVGGNSYSAGKYGGKKIFNDDKTDEEALEFYTQILKVLYKVTTDDVSIYWWLGFNKMGMVNLQAFLNSGWHMSQMIIWVKEQMVFSFGQDYHRMSEPVFFGWKKGNQHFLNRRISNLKDVFSLDRESFDELPDTWFERRDRTTDYIHPTQKPVRLAERALKKNSQHGDIVIDAFGGSGSTLIGCEQAGRRGRIMEMDPKFCHAILNRWAKFTGKDPVREDGVAWSEIIK